MELVEALIVPNDSFFRINVKDLFKREMLDIARNFSFRPSDIVIMGLPRAGTSVIAELVWLLVNKYDYEGAQKFIGSRVPTLENYINFHVLKMKNPYYKRTEEMTEIDDFPEPRIIITHLPLACFPKLKVSNESTPYIIFVDRDIKEIFVSLFHYLTAVSKVYNGTINNFLDLFKNNIDPFCPWIKQIQELRDLSVNRKVLYIPYEDITGRFPKVIVNIVHFIEKQSTVPIPEFKKLEQHFFPHRCKQNSAVNHVNQYGAHGFIRKCKSGKSKEELPKDIWDHLNKHVEKFNLSNSFDAIMEKPDTPLTVPTTRRTM